MRHAFRKDVLRLVKSHIKKAYVSGALDAVDKKATSKEAEKYCNKIGIK
jgi:hypothetical protein